MPGWRCQNCGKVHRLNPAVCRNCGNTILTQHRGRGGRLKSLVLGALCGAASAYAYLQGFIPVI
jgi:DNA-directed RNA polymerase subunit RPC12/RpoP